MGRVTPLVVTIFEMYAKNESRFADIADYLYSQGIKTKGGKVYKPDKVKKILTNPFYYGHFRYLGEIHEGKHKSICHPPHILNTLSS